MMMLKPLPSVVYIFLLLMSWSYAISFHCKNTSYKVSCTGTIKKHMGRGVFSRVIKYFNTLEVRDTDIIHLEGDWFEGRNNFTSLELIHNKKLTALHNNSFEYLQNLNSLNLSHNNISSLSFSIFFPLVNLTILSLDNNNLRVLPTGIFARQSKLKELSLSYNKVASFHSGLFSSLENLEKLYLSHNKLVSLDSRSFVALENLTVLNLSHNVMTFLRPTVFVYQKNLKELRLDMNNISSLDPELLSPLKRLEILSFESNHVHKMDSLTLQPLARLQKLNMLGCPMTCDCLLKNLYWQCKKRSIEANMTCSYLNKVISDDIGRVLEEIDCKVISESTILLIAILFMLLAKASTDILLAYKRYVWALRSWKSTESVNEYEYVESPIDVNSRTYSDLGHRESRKYMSVLQVAMDVYDYLRPQPGRKPSVVGVSNIIYGNTNPTMPQANAPSRPPSDMYDAAM